LRQNKANEICNSAWQIRPMLQKLCQNKLKTGGVSYIHISDNHVYANVLKKVNSLINGQR